MDTSKIELDYAKKQGDETIPRAWSRHTAGSSAYALTHKRQGKMKFDNEQEEKLDKVAVEEKKDKFRQFLKLMGVQKDSAGGQSWNDSFADHMNAEGNNKQIRDMFRQANGKDDQPEEKEEQVEEGADKKENKEEDTGKAAAEDDIEHTRLFVMNLSYKVTHDEVRDHFEVFGPIDHIEIPLRKGGKGQAAGFAYISFTETEAAISAYAQNDKTYF